jgi:hypothetical protein
VLAARLLGPRVRIPRGAWTFVFVLRFVFSCFGIGLCDELITSAKESFHMSNDVKNPKKEGQALHGP